jgi:hypothetical protein
MDKEKIAKLQAQVRIGMFTVVTGDETDTMPSLTIRHTIPYFYTITYTSTIKYSRLYKLPILVSLRSTISICLTSLSLGFDK